MLRQVLLLSGFLGCSAAKETSPGHTESAMDDGMLDSGSWGDGGEADSALSAPTHWLLSGSLMVRAGELDASVSHLTIDMYDLGGEFICTQSVGLQSAARVSDLPDPDVDLWWEVETEATADGDCLQGEITNPLPALSYLGMGAVHPEIEAVLDSEAGDAPSADVESRSVFIALGPEASVWVFGLATTDASASSPLDEGVAGLSIPDGSWKFSALYSFPYTD